MTIKILKKINCIISLLKQIINIVYEYLIFPLLTYFVINENYLIKFYNCIIKLIVSIYNKNIKNIENIFITAYKSLYTHIIDIYFILKENKTLNLYKLYKELNIIKNNKEIHNVPISEKILYHLLIMSLCSLIGPIYITLFII